MKLARTLVVGVGNPLRGDDAVGLVVAREVRAALGPESDVVVVELWTGGLNLAETLAGFDVAVLVDATAMGGCAPGTVRRLEIEECSSCCYLDSIHDATFPAALETFSRLGIPMPTRITVVGVEVERMDVVSESLTPAVEAAVGAAVKAVLSALDWRL